MKQHRNQSGALLLEVLAVLGLVGMMAPFLYRQALERNREVSNVAIASEMRTITEALRTALEVDFDPTTNCVQNWSDANNDSIACTRTPDISFYLPANYAIANSYDIRVFCQNTLCLCSIDGGVCEPDTNNNNNDSCDVNNRGGGNPTYTEPVCYGLIMSARNNLPQNLTLRRARRIASLIGASGGVCTGAPNNGNATTTTINGTMGSWNLNLPNGTCEIDTTGYGLAANTGIVTTMIGTEDAGQANAESVVDVPNNLGLRDIHAWRYFSVGDNTQNCYSSLRVAGNINGVNANANTSGDTIHRVGENNGTCDPLFWVGKWSDNHDNNIDHSIEGQVYIKNDLSIGRDNTNNRESIFLGREDPANNNNSGRIIVYDTNGTDTITIQGGTGNTGATPVITMTQTLNGDRNSVEITTAAEGQGGDLRPQITLTENAGNTQNQIRLTSQGLKAGKQGDDAGTFYVDPAYTSYMEDIRIGARGDARLSQILPNYILKNIVNITGNDDITVPTSTNNPSNTALTCPEGYNRALVVVPTGRTSVEFSKDSTNQNLLPITAEKGNVSISVDTKTGSGTLTIPELTPKTNALTHKYPAVSISNNASLDKNVVASSSDTQWNVILGYCTDRSCSNNNFTSDSNMTAIAYVYCVYNNGATDTEKDPNTLQDRLSTRQAQQQNP